MVFIVVATDHHNARRQLEMRRFWFATDDGHPMTCFVFENKCEPSLRIISASTTEKSNQLDASSTLDGLFNPFRVGTE
jgi:hypothetical protein